MPVTQIHVIVKAAYGNELAYVILGYKIDVDLVQYAMPLMIIKGRGCDNEGYIILGDEVGSVVDMASVIVEVYVAVWDCFSAPISALKNETLNAEIDLEGGCSSVFRRNKRRPENKVTKDEQTAVTSNIWIVKSPVVDNSFSLFDMDTVPKPRIDMVRIPVEVVQYLSGKEGSPRRKPLSPPRRRSPIARRGSPPPRRRSPPFRRDDSPPPRRRP
ncbi:hypothetical protein Tco_1530620 [Tanacetum coccineum]